ncbi:MAG: response regulator [Planctomycetes bacterium]|nr:response regulator [Planctomycetota bacterium]
MSATYFAQECPSCGRHLQVRLEYLGKSVACQHCQRQFDAMMAPPLSDSSEDLLNRADELLATVETASKPLPR